MSDDGGNEVTRQLFLSSLYLPFSSVQPPSSSNQTERDEIRGRDGVPVLPPFLFPFGLSHLPEELYIYTKGVEVSLPWSSSWAFGALLPLAL